MIVCATMVSVLGVNILNRESLDSSTMVTALLNLISLEAAIKKVENDLRATSGEISLTLSIFTVTQGAVPPLWTALSEIKGRKVRPDICRLAQTLYCYVVSPSSSTPCLLQSLWWDA